MSKQDEMRCVDCGIACTEWYQDKDDAVCTPCVGGRWRTAIVERDAYRQSAETEHARMCMENSARLKAEAERDQNAGQWSAAVSAEIAAQAQIQRLVIELDEARSEIAAVTMRTYAEVEAKS